MWKSHDVLEVIKKSPKRECFFALEEFNKSLQFLFFLNHLRKIFRTLRFQGTVTKSKFDFDNGMDLLVSFTSITSGESL